jgi:hypothetical protein
MLYEYCVHIYVVCNWGYNTDPHRGVANAIPYQLAFGQVPQVGISFLPLSPAILDSLHTEAQYRQAQLSIDGNFEEGFQPEDALGADDNALLEVMRPLYNPPLSPGLHRIGLTFYFNLACLFVLCNT